MKKKGSTKKTWKVKEIAKYEKIVIQKKCNMKKVQHEDSATRKICKVIIVPNEKSNMKKVQHEENVAWRKCIIESETRKKNATWKMCNRMQHENSATWTK